MSQFLVILDQTRVEFWKLKEEIWAKLNLKYELKNMKNSKTTRILSFQTTNSFIISINFKIKKTLEKVNNFDKYFNKPSEVTSVKSRSFTYLLESEK